jgi:hypothetical protein
LPADVAQFAAVAASELARRNAQSGAELAATGKALRFTDTRCHGNGCQYANTADFIQLAHQVIIGMSAVKLFLAFRHALYVQVVFCQDDMH